MVAMSPETRYARSGNVNIAYQVVGEGPRDLILVPGWLSNVEVFWDDPAVARFLRRLASVRRELSRYRGKQVGSAGDGVLATFDGPARGIRCGRSIADSVLTLGIKVRTGLHTGECEIIEDNIGGIAVHTAARVAALADSGEVLVSHTVRDLVAGSGIHFESRGTHTLKGVAGDWQLFAAVP